MPNRPPTRRPGRPARPTPLLDAPTPPDGPMPQPPTDREARDAELLATGWGPGVLPISPTWDGVSPTWNELQAVHVRRQIEALIRKRQRDGAWPDRETSQLLDMASNMLMACQIQCRQGRDGVHGDAGEDEL